jgi:hypothetical protein
MVRMLTFGMRIQASIQESLKRNPIIVKKGAIKWFACLVFVGSATAGSSRVMLTANIAESQKSIVTEVRKQTVRLSDSCIRNVKIDIIIWGILCCCCRLKKIQHEEK